MYPNYPNQKYIQVYAIWMEWLNGLAPDIQSQVTHFMYDDMCHLKVKINCNYFDFFTYVFNLQKYACNTRSKRSELATFFASRKMCVDHLHFKYDLINLHRFINYINLGDIRKRTPTAKITPTHITSLNFIQ